VGNPVIGHVDKFAMIDRTWPSLKAGGVGLTVTSIYDRTFPNRAVAQLEDGAKADLSTDCTVSGTSGLGISPPINQTVHSALNGEKLIAFGEW
jgi:hypothetical protein